jgi:GNAT superfamily N-acetyltransferase
VERVPGGLRVHYGKPGLLMDLIALQADVDSESLRRLATQAAAMPETVLTVPTTSANAVRAVLADAGLDEIDDEPEALMSRPLSGHPDLVPRGPYRTVVANEEATISVRVLHSSGEVVARGGLALSGADAIPVDIVTEPAHRRQGLGSVVMSALVQQAANRGATTGVLVASPQGRHLYAALGWTHHADVLVARSRVDSSA